MQHGLNKKEASNVGKAVIAAFQMDSCIDLVVWRVQKWMSYAHHPMQAEDRLGNKAINFPIAFCYGDADIHGSEGAFELVKMNPHYESGRS